jgi:hypothetical protein
VGGVHPVRAWTAICQQWNGSGERAPQVCRRAARDGTAAAAGRYGPGADAGRADCLGPPTAAGRRGRPQQVLRSGGGRGPYRLEHGPRTPPVNVRPSPAPADIHVLRSSPRPDQRQAPYRADVSTEQNHSEIGTLAVRASANSPEVPSTGPGRAAILPVGVKPGRRDDGPCECRRGSAIWGKVGPARHPPKAAGPVSSRRAISGCTGRRRTRCRRAGRRPHGPGR